MISQKQFSRSFARVGGLARVFAVGCDLWRENQNNSSAGPIAVRVVGWPRSGNGGSALVRRGEQTRVKHVRGGIVQKGNSDDL